MPDQPSSSSKSGPSAGDHLGPYQIIGELGSGGMGVVYRAHDSRLGRDVALKIIRRPSPDPDHVARFAREARAAGSLNHPNIVAVYDVGTEGGVPYVVTELLEGETLRARLRHGLLPYRKAVDYGVQMAQALDAAHRKGIFHRDVKPGNVFVTEDGRVKLLDFGIAKLVEPDPKVLADAETTDASQTGSIRGTPGYMSPEQVVGEPVDHRTDIFALGAILYEMFTGARAFDGASKLETTTAVLKADPVDPLTLNVGLSPVAAAVVRRCLEKNKEDRFQSARDLAFQLQQLSDLTSGTGTRGSVPASDRRKRRAAVIAAMLLGAAAMTMLLWWFVSPPAAPVFERLTFSRGRIGGARFASNGTAVVYSLASQGHALEISRIDLADSPSSRSLGYGSGTDILAARAGELALLLKPRFVQGERFVGTLGVAPLGGAPSERGEDIEYADWSPSGDLAVVQSTGTVGGQSQIEYPQGTKLYTTKNLISFLRVSPDGQRLAFLEDPGGRRGPSGIVSILDKSANVTTLTKDWESLRGLAWSPNGREIWFTAADDEKGGNRALRAVTLDRKERLVLAAPGSLTLWDIAADGRVLLTLDEERRAVLALPPDETVERDVSWFDQSGLAAISSDGRWLLCGDRFGVYRRGTDGSQPMHLIREALADDLSRDGKTVLATMDNRQKLVILPSGTSLPQPLPAHGIVRYNGAWWFPDSDARRVLFTGQKEGEVQRSYVQEVRGGAPTPITPEGTWGVAISQDGRWIAAISKSQPIRVWPVGAGTSKPVPGAQEDERPVAFSEDGKSLWLIRRGEIPANVYTLELATGRRQLWKRLSPPDNAGVYSIIDFNITANGKAYAYSYSRLLSQLYLVRGLK